MSTLFHFVYSHSIAFLVLFVLMNLVTFLLFRKDKKKAEKKAFRIPEKDLLWFSFLFGALGGMLGMVLYHHKTRKPKFYILVPLFAILQLVLIILVFRLGSTNA